MGFISNKSHYALLAVFELAKAKGKPTSSSVISARHGIPQRFLEQILGELRREGVIYSQRGKEGGYLLSKFPKDISVGEVISVFRRGEACMNKVSNSAVEEVFSDLEQDIEDMMREALADVSFDTVLRRERELSDKNTGFVANYSI